MNDWQDKVNKIVGLGSKSLHKSYYPELKGKVDELDRQTVFYQSVLKSIPDSIAITDTSGGIVQVNPAFVKLFGYSAAELVGTQLSDLYQDMPENILDDSIWVGAAQCYRCKNGSFLIGETRLTDIIGSDGSLLGYLEVIRDLGEKIVAFNRYKKIEERLRQAQKLEAFGNLAGGIAHDFNNILSGIIGFGELAEMYDAVDHDKVSHSIKQMLQASYRARDLVKQILVFSRYDEGELKVLHLGPVIEEALTLIRASLPSTIGITTDFDVQADVIMGDATQIHQVVMNLCTNAAHAMSGNSDGSLHVSLSLISEPLALLRDAGVASPAIVIEVADNGVGIIPEILPEIFEPYFTTKQRYEGTGFGLALVHGIVRNHNGCVDVVSAVGKGSVFKVFFPLETQAVPLVTEESVRTVTRKKGSRILVVDDEKQQVAWCKKFLTKSEFYVDSFLSSEEAFAYFEQHAADFDAVITDQTMPHLTGMHLAKNIRKLRQDIPIILCTGFANAISEEELAEVNIAKVLNKPVSLKELAAALDDVL